eukprot:COSAG06_NODE_318_length_17640_cov_41.730916_11_plen_79_part_00
MLRPPSTLVATSEATSQQHNYLPPHSTPNHAQCPPAYTTARPLLTHRSSARRVWPNAAYTCTSPALDASQRHGQLSTQ